MKILIYFITQYETPYYHGLLFVKLNQGWELKNYDDRFSLIFFQSRNIRIIIYQLNVWLILSE